MYNFHAILPAEWDQHNDKNIIVQKYIVTGKAGLEDCCYEVLRLEDEWTSEEREQVPKTGVDSTKT